VPRRKSSVRGSGRYVDPTGNPSEGSVRADAGWVPRSTRLAA
jgi:hypothetical protein